MSLDFYMNQFRLAHRELFNHYFRITDPWANTEAAWALVEQFSDVEAILFQKMVSERLDMQTAAYGERQPNIKAKLKTGSSVPIMINREINSGYWDCPVKEVGDDADLIFRNYFDWDNLSYRDNKYVRVEIVNWPAHRETVGKHALLESSYVAFV